MQQTGHAHTFIVSLPFVSWLLIHIHEFPGATAKGCFLSFLILLLSHCSLIAHEQKEQTGAITHNFFELVPNDPQ